MLPQVVLVGGLDNAHSQCAGIASHGTCDTPWPHSRHASPPPSAPHRTYQSRTPSLGSPSTATCPRPVLPLPLVPLAPAPPAPSSSRSPPSPPSCHPTSVSVAMSWASDVWMCTLRPFGKRRWMAVSSRYLPGGKGGQRGWTQGKGKGRRGGRGGEVLRCVLRIETTGLAPQHLPHQPGLAHTGIRIFISQCQPALCQPLNAIPIHTSP